MNSSVRLAFRQILPAVDSDGPTTEVMLLGLRSPLLGGYDSDNAREDFESCDLRDYMSELLPDRHYQIAGQAGLVWTSDWRTGEVDMYLELADGYEVAEISEEEYAKYCDWLNLRNVRPSDDEGAGTA